jgi:alkanesulfonate monooxygenase SsuD/methylene tetrahydromethanopterin reductase-like flavin-dependent oxidoreductase (luciferase family)
MVKLGLVYMPRSVGEAVEVARAAEESGFWGLGICDSPMLYSEMYPVVSACLAATSRLHVGPNVTNPVTRHWAVHGAALRTYEELAPGRFVLGIGAGDGAVYSVGLRPAKTGEVAEAVKNIRSVAPGCGPIHVGMGGPRGVAAARQVADAVIVGTGADAVAVREMCTSEPYVDPNAQAPETWGLVALNVVHSEADVAAARREIQPIANAYARHAFDHTFEKKNVPEEYHEVLMERFSLYRFQSHAQIRDDNPNAQIFDDLPALARYVLDRFAIVGTAGHCRERVSEFAAAAKLDGIWFPVTVTDPVANVRLAGEALKEYLA